MFSVCILLTASGEKTLSIIARFRNEFCSKEEVIKADKHTSGASDRYASDYQSDFDSIYLIVLRFRF